MSMCNCNQGRLPYTCKPIEGETIMSDISISTGHPDAGRVYAEALDRVTAERDALQERLNAADQSEDDLTFQLNDREASRYDWLQAAQAAEKRVEVLEKRYCCLGNDQLELVKELDALRAQLAERDALLRECADEFNTAEASAFEVEMYRKINAALSASAEPSAQVEVVGVDPLEGEGDGGPHEARMMAQRAPVERDERAELPAFAKKIIRKLQRTRDCFEDSQGTDIGREWLDVLTKLGLMNRVQRSPALWEISDDGDALLDARAAMDKATEGASHE